MRYLLALWYALVAMLISVHSAPARQVQIPVRFDLGLVRQALLTQLYSEPGEKAVILDDNQSCQWFYLFEPTLDVSGSRLRIISRADVGRGVMMKQKCIGQPPWKGFVEVLEQLEMDNATGTLALRTADWNLYDETRSKKISSGIIWNLIKKPVQDRINEVRIDFAPLVHELQTWLPLVLTGEPRLVKQVADSVKIRQPVLSADAITLTLTFALEGVPQAYAKVPEPALSPRELEAIRQHLRQWDAFITFVVKELARTEPEAVQRQLINVLLEARHDLSSALEPVQGRAPDPVQALFMRTWERLAPLVRAMTSSRSEQAALQYLSFISAADALAALQAASPLGVDLSADGLRRLARMLQPAPSADPLAYSLDVDPELRMLMGFGPPLPPPSLAPEVELDLTGRADWMHSVMVEAHTAVRSVVQMWRGLVPEALAEIDPDGISRLNRWVPRKEELTSYLALVHDLLQQASARTLAAGTCPAQYSELYRNLVLATAWQESCWRQFIRSGQKIVPLKSTVGSVGLMQINQHVWRGVYDLKGIYGDIAYNAAAGCEILLHYLRDYALAKGEHLQPGGAENLARATYAAYNGGPGQLARYRRTKTKPSLQTIDRLFWEKYKTVREGRVMAVSNCYE